MSIASLATVFALAASGMAADYYVNDTTGLDENPGTAALPFKTAAKALEQADVTQVFFQTDMNLGTPSASPTKTDCAVVVPASKGTITFAGDNNSTKTITGRFFIQEGNNVTLENLAVQYAPEASTDFGADRGVVVTEGKNVKLTLNSVSVTQNGKGDVLYLGAGNRNNDCTGTEVTSNDSVITTNEAADYCSQAVTLRGANVKLTLNTTYVSCPENASHPFGISLQGDNDTFEMNSSIVLASRAYAMCIEKNGTNVTIAQNSYVKGWAAVNYLIAVASGVLNVSDSTLVGVNKSYQGYSNSYATVIFEKDATGYAKGLTATFTNSKIMTEAGSYKTLGLLYDAAAATENSIIFEDCVFENNSNVADPTFEYVAPSIISPSGNVVYKSTSADKNIETEAKTVTLTGNNEVLVFGTGVGTGLAIEADGAASGATITAQMTDKTQTPPPTFFKHQENLQQVAYKISGENVGTAFVGTLTIGLPSVENVNALYRVFDDTVEEFSVANNKLSVNTATKTVTATGVTGFSTWYVGNTTAVPVSMSTFSLE